LTALLGAVLLGWALGANDAANVFGPAIACRALRYAVGVATAAVCVLLGAALGGGGPIGTIGGLSPQTQASALLVTLSAGLAMTLLLLLRLPASSSQAVVGAVVGVALGRGVALDTPVLVRVAVGWVLTPIAAAGAALVAYVALAAVLRRRRPPSLLRLDVLLRLALLGAGAWASYALGANNAGNVTGVFVGSGLLTPHQAAILAGASIGVGMLTFGQRMMELVGRDLVQLEPATALLAMLAQAFTVHVFAVLGVPVSTSQALAGGALGIGVAKGVRTIGLRTLMQILSGWVATPLGAGLLGWLGTFLLPSR
jgi:PiT family inorganic phosphate transporter